MFCQKQRHETDFKFLEKKKKGTNKEGVNSLATVERRKCHRCHCYGQTLGENHRDVGRGGWRGLAVPTAGGFKARG